MSQRKTVDPGVLALDHSPHRAQAGAARHTPAGHPATGPHPEHRSNRCTTSATPPSPRTPHSSGPGPIGDGVQQWLEAGDLVRLLADVQPRVDGDALDRAVGRRLIDRHTGHRGGLFGGQADDRVGGGERGPAGLAVGAATLDLKGQAGSEEQQVVQGGGSTRTSPSTRPTPRSGPVRLAGDGRLQPGHQHDPPRRMSRHGPRPAATYSTSGRLRR